MSLTMAPLTEPTSEMIAPGLRCARDLLRHRSAGADGNAEDDEIGVLDRFRIGRHTWSTMPSSITRARVFSERAVVTISAARPWSFAARAIEPPIRPKPISATRWKCGVRAHLPAMKSRRPSTTRRLASSVPMVMRSACGRP